MKSIKLIALTLVIVLVACVFVSCNQQEKALKALEDANGALDIYSWNISADMNYVEDGTVFVVEKSGRWYSFIFEDKMLVRGEIYKTAPETPEGLVLETNEDSLNLIPENITIYIPKP